MLRINELGSHASSSIKILNDIQSLAKRDDLYTGEDFYFGFDSSNLSFLDIIGDKAPLAIKHGPTLCLYQRTETGCQCSVFYINVESKALHPVITVNSKVGATYRVDSLFPWSFEDYYIETTGSEDRQAASTKRSTAPEHYVESLIETLATNNWPDELLIQNSTNAIAKLSNSTLHIELCDLSTLKKQLEKNDKHSSVPCIATYDPFNDNARIAPDFLMKKYSDQIVVRQINGQDTRIEIICAKSTPFYNAVYQKSSDPLYQSLKNALADPESLKDLLNEHFPEVMCNYPENDNTLGKRNFS